MFFTTLKHNCFSWNVSYSSEAYLLKLYATFQEKEWAHPIVNKLCNKYNSNLKTKSNKKGTGRKKKLRSLMMHTLFMKTMAERGGYLPLPLLTIWNIWLASVRSKMLVWPSSWEAPVQEQICSWHRREILRKTAERILEIKRKTAESNMKGFWLLLVLHFL